MIQRAMRGLRRADGIMLVLAALSGLALLIELSWPHPLDTGRLPARPPERAEVEELPTSRPPEPLGAFASIYRRPLFRADRKPFVAPPPPPEAVEPFRDLTPEPEIEFELDAVVITPGVRLAFLRASGQPSRKVHEGEMIEAWTLASIQPHAVSLVRREQTQVVPLHTGDFGDR